MELEERIRLTAHSSCGGCASKVGSADLQLALRHLALPAGIVPDPNVLVGHGTADDAGVYRLTPDLALVQTVDFFTPIVDDPYDFGRIAATNALSDIYAMGGTPLTALNICAFPVEKLGTEVLGRILAGGASVAADAGVAILGGHTVKDDEPKYGMAVTGTIHPDRVVTNSGARPGDLLLLTKPVGTGILTTARKNDAISEAQLAPAIAWMTTLNKRAGAAMVSHGAHAGTDITGFGILGHGGEMGRGSGVALSIDSAKVPLMDGVLELIRSGVAPGGTRANRAEHAAFTEFADSVEDALRTALSDAQTSGGLLMSIPRAGAEAVIAELDFAVIIGEVVAGPTGRIFVR